MKYRRVMIAAPKSGSGKTMITCALLWALKDRGEKTVSFKCGPDYIDPMFHSRIIGAGSGNLDPFFFDRNTLRYHKAFYGWGREGYDGCPGGRYGSF